MSFKGFFYFKYWKCYRRQTSINISKEATRQKCFKDKSHMEYSATPTLYNVIMCKRNEYLAVRSFFLMLCWSFHALWILFISPQEMLWRHGHLSVTNLLLVHMLSNHHCLMRSFYLPVYICDNMVPMMMSKNTSPNCTLCTLRFEFSSNYPLLVPS